MRKFRSEWKVRNYTRSR